tara:strand:+ start:6078 stop:7166 length:1089 start_codon:yes stop_codon:yes gene_type:complete
MKFAFLRNPSLGHLILNSLWMFKPPKRSRVIIFYSSEESANIAVERVVVDQLKSKSVKCVNCNLYILKALKLFFSKLSSLLKKLGINYQIIEEIEWLHRRDIGDRLKYGGKYKYFDEEGFAKKLKPIKINSDINNSFLSFLDKNNIKEPYVAVFSRDNTFVDKVYGSSVKQGNTRNSSFENLVPSLNYLIEKGYSIVRMGIAVKKREAIDNQMYFDYGACNSYNPWYDLLFVRDARFLITSNSGFSCIQTLFNTPTLVLNWMPLGFKPPYRNSLFIPKNVKYQSSQIKPIDLDESCFLAEEIDNFDKHDYELEENSSEEIYDAVKDMLNWEHVNASSYESLLPIVDGGFGLLCKSYYKKFVK